jgi:phage portal protein BeeE
LVEAPEEVKLAPPWGSDVAIPPQTPPEDAMSALSLTWVYIAATTCAADLASLPRYVVRKGERLDDHPALSLFRKPRTGGSAVAYTRQRWIDFYLAGDRYDVILSSGRRGPVSLQRLHPAEVKHVTGIDGDVRAYEHGQPPVTYSAADVLHAHDVSYLSGPDGTYGYSRIEALARDLNLDVKAIKLATDASERGAPSFAVSPAAAEDRWNAQQVAALTKHLNDLLRRSAGGALVLGGQAELTQLGYSPKDAEFVAISERVQQRILSAFRVSPTIVGLPGANYATAEREAVGYWEARRSDAVLMDDVDSRLVERMGQPGDRIVTDFSGVAALAAILAAEEEKRSRMRTEALNRVVTLYTLGLPLQVALDAEGFDNVVLPVTEEVVSNDQALNGAQLVGAATIVEKVAAGLIPRESGIELIMLSFLVDRVKAEAILGNAGNGFVPTPEPGTAPAPAPEPARARSALPWATSRSIAGTTEEERATYWRTWERTIRSPGEKRFALECARALNKSRDRILGRLEQLGPQLPTERAGSAEHQRDPAAAVIAQILGTDAEAAAMLEALKPSHDKLLEAAMKALAKRLSVSVAGSQAVGDSAIREATGFISQHTSETVQRLILEGIENGDSVTKIADAIRRSGAFAPSRALTIARTESTRAVNAGSVAQIAHAVDEGAAVVGIEWLSSRDGIVRDAHVALDAGAPIPIGGDFTHLGKTAKFPGGFGDPAYDCNCRCTVVPVLED